MKQRPIYRLMLKNFFQRVDCCLDCGHLLYRTPGNPGLSMKYKYFCLFVKLRSYNISAIQFRSINILLTTGDISTPLKLNGK